MVMKQAINQDKNDIVTVILEVNNCVISVNGHDVTVIREQNSFTTRMDVFYNSVFGSSISSIVFNLWYGTL